MHKKTSAFFALVIGCAATTPALAVDQGETYLGGGFGLVTYDADGLPEFNPTAGIGRLGYGLIDNVAIEGRLGFGISDDTNSDGFGNEASVEVDELAGVYAVGYLPVAERFSLYGLAGLTSGEATATATNANGQLIGTETEDDSDFSYGVGAEAYVSDSIAGYGEWVSYFDGDDYDITAFTLGIKYSF